MNSGQLSINNYQSSINYQPILVIQEENILQVAK
jgi:hypothetical protein